MMKLHIPDMSCGHCVGVITTALKRIDQDATITFDVPAHTAELKTSQAPDVVLATLAAEGYPATAA